MDFQAFHLSKLLVVERCHWGAVGKGSSGKIVPKLRLAGCLGQIGTDVGRGKAPLGKDGA